MQEEKTEKKLISNLQGLDAEQAWSTTIREESDFARQVILLMVRSKSKIDVSSKIQIVNYVFENLELGLISCLMEANGNE